VRFVVDGQIVDGFEDEPVAVALLAAGRPVLSRSFRFHRPRGLMCSTGQCGWCECRIDGRPSVRACRVPLREGLRVESEHALPSVRRDVLGLLDLGSRWVSPTFYHHRFLRPKRLRKRYLDVIRRFGGRGRIEPDAEPVIGRPKLELSADVAVIGGGPAGLAAARSAIEAGATVVLLEAEAATGGPWRWREDPVPGLGDPAAVLAGLGSAATVLMETTALGVYDGLIAAVGPDAVLSIRSRAIVVATGSYERLPSVPGNDRPGVIGARTVEWLIRAHGVLPGDRAVVVGSGPDAERAAAAIETAAGRIVASLASDELLAIEGTNVVRGVRHASVVGRGRIRADLVVVADRTPATELADSGGPGIHLVGTAAGRPIDGPEAVAAARAAGGAAAAADSPPPLDRVHGAAPTSGGSIPDRAMVCFCEDVRAGEIRHEAVLGYTDPELVKRRTGALTGPCQGKYCAMAVAAIAGPGGDAAWRMPTVRPPARPVRLGDLDVADADTPASDPADSAG
jgi:sarcosine oxidase subunit alpha